MQNSLGVGGGGEGIGEKHTGRVGTPLYCSPEVLKGGMYNEKVGEWERGSFFFWYFNDFDLFFILIFFFFFFFFVSRLICIV